MRRGRRRIDSHGGQSAGGRSAVHVRIGARCCGANADTDGRARTGPRSHGHCCTGADGRTADAHACTHGDAGAHP